MKIVLCEESGRILRREWKCQCSRMVCSSSGEDIACECGQLYNAFGQRLVDPCLWEEEQGDPLDDWNYVGSRHHY
jgi:hypothetical protein